MSQETALATFQEVIRTLLGPQGCPWDKEQTPTTLCQYLIEESHELVAAIRHGGPADVCDELGDVLFLLVFIAELNAAKNEFTLDDAIRGAAAKMIRRHPHVFEGTTFATRDEQLKAWETIKRAEKKTEDGTPTGIFASLPETLPSLIKAYRIHSKAARAGFTWDSDTDVEQQVEAEWLELIEAFQGDDKDAQEHELGDILLTLVELGRRKGLKAEEAMDKANQRFLTRFQKMETLAGANNQEFTALSMEEKNALWDKVKTEETL